MKVVLAATSSLFFAVSVQAAQVADGVDVPELSHFDAAMIEFMEAHNIADGQLAVTRLGKLVLARSYEHNSIAPTTIHSRFRIASVSKPLTSTLLHRAQQDGLLSLDDTIDEYLDLTPLAGQNVDPRLAGVTIRNLLQHLGGFGDPAQYGFDPVFHDAAVRVANGVGYPVLKTHILRFMNGRELIHEPGTTYAYSNYGYMLAGMILETATGISYGAYADQILNPAGIYDARLSRSQFHRQYAGEARYYSGNIGRTVIDDSREFVPIEYGGLNFENNSSYGGWTASAVEIVRFLSNLDDPDAEDAMINADSREEMFGLPENYNAPYNNGALYYSSGWAVRKYGPDRYNTSHSGGLPGTMTYAIRYQSGVNYMVAFSRRDESGQSDWYIEIDQKMSAAISQTAKWPSHDLFPTTLRPEPEPAGARYSGSWYDTTHDGEGFAIAVVNPTTAVIYWFTYDREGRQRWYFGLARLEGHRMMVDSLLATHGGKFGPDFDPEDVQTTEVGSLVINFYDGGHAKADYLLNADSGFMELTRLSVPFTSDDPAASGGDWRNGLWYDPTHDGEGYVVEVLPDGRIVIYWFTYDDDGEPAWMIGTVKGPSLEDGADILMELTEGGNFGVGFDPENVVLSGNGTGTIRIRCHAASVAEYSGGDARFPEVALNLERLATYLNPSCP